MAPPGSVSQEATAAAAAVAKVGALGWEGVEAREDIMVDKVVVAAISEVKAVAPGTEEEAMMDLVAAGMAEGMGTAAEGGRATVAAADGVLETAKAAHLAASGPVVEEAARDPELATREAVGAAMEA